MGLRGAAGLRGAPDPDGEREQENPAPVRSGGVRAATGARSLMAPPPPFGTRQVRNDNQDAMTFPLGTGAIMKAFPVTERTKSQPVWTRRRLGSG